MTRPIYMLSNIYKLSFWIIIIQLNFGCSTSDNSKYKEGKQLASVHCASCHLAPSPSSLPSNVWDKGVLPVMGLRMGMNGHGNMIYNDPSIPVVKPAVSNADWKKIVQYYIHTSPEKLADNTQRDTHVSEVFKSEVFSYESKLSSMITMVSFDKENNKLLLGEAHSSSLVSVNVDGKILGSTRTHSPPVKILKKDSLEYLLGIGSLHPSDASTGFLRINKDFIYGLKRPVDFLVTDINKDGFDDVLVCNFGYSKGDFSLYKNLKNGSYEKEIIHPQSGAIKVEFANIDQDPEKEIIVLFAQEHESLMIWDVENNSFNGKKVLQFHPSFGASDFQLKDIDNDGDKDLILSNGDNADYSRVLKDYHGVRIFLNDGNKDFSEKYYYPMHGASKVEVEDFDLDGDLDILMISNFGNISDSKFKSVKLLRNQGSLNFKPESIKGLPNYRWQTIDISDFDSDGDLDAFLGAFSINIGPKESDVTDKKEISWVKLENLTK